MVRKGKTIPQAPRKDAEEYIKDLENKKVI